MIRAVAERLVEAGKGRLWRLQRSSLALLGLLAISAVAAAAWNATEARSLTVAYTLLSRASGQRAVGEHLLRTVHETGMSGDVAAATAVDRELVRTVASTREFAAWLALWPAHRALAAAAQRSIAAAESGDRLASIRAQQAYIAAIDVTLDVARRDVDTRAARAQAAAAAVTLVQVLLIALIAFVGIKGLGAVAASLEHDLEQRARVREMMEMIQSISGRDELAKALRTHLTQALPGMNGAVYLFSASRDAAELVGSWGPKPADTDEFSISDCWALRLGKAYGSDDGSHLACSHSLPDARGWCLPMLADGEALGVLSVRADDGQAISASGRARAVRLAEGLSVTLANMRLRETLRNQSIRDPLTGIFNRRYMEESLKRELKRASRRHYALTVMMIDLDHFKRLNDTFGHAAGDEVLCAFGQFLATRCRMDDVVCRFGGEEFVVIFPEMNMKDALVKGQALNAAWAQVCSNTGRASATFSTGFATYPEHATTAEGLLGTADAALYLAKSSGRDKVCGPGEGLCLLPVPQPDGTGRGESAPATVPNVPFSKAS